ncbi:hypothetical protein FSP39_012581 [Pinctada imbricata]|uniref:Uncharacterized protein n=1 Tax=Pinctada imbricata TaxID=66713 RepID=A0AA88XCY0_PINIB|nr:hypothetical protein FSP39_012581 [Pinctada imbricata]
MYLVSKHFQYYNNYDFQIVNRHPPFGNQLRDSVSYLPKYELTIDQVAKYGESCSEIIINISIANAEKVQQGKTTSDYHMCMLLIGDEDNHIVFRRKIMDTHLIKDGGFTKKIEVSRAANGPDLNIDFISQEWVGIDVQCRYTPIYLGGTKRIANTVRKDQQCSSVALSIAGYNCKIEYVKGEDNHCADLLSRIPHPKMSKQSKKFEYGPDIDDRAFEIGVINANEFNPRDFASCQVEGRDEISKAVSDLPEEFNLKEEQEKDQEIVKLKNRLRKGTATKAEQTHYFEDKE